MTASGLAMPPAFLDAQEPILARVAAIRLQTLTESECPRPQQDHPRAEGFKDGIVWKWSGPIP